MGIIQRLDKHLFDSLTNRLGDVFDKLTRRGSLSEADVDAALREVRVALLEADVALPVVKDLIARVKERSVGSEVLKSVTPGQQVVKIVNDALVDTLGREVEEINLKARPPAVMLIVGLQGSGKTTTAAKIGKYLTEKERKRVLLASLDTRRPAAQEQLRVLGEQARVATLPVVTGEPPIAIARRALQTGTLEAWDVVILDTAGRLHIDQELMDEVAEASRVTEPAETLLVADAMTGQDAVTIAREFDEKIGVTGIVLTRIDGDARGHVICTEICRLSRSWRMREGAVVAHIAAQLGQRDKDLGAIGNQVVGNHRWATATGNSNLLPSPALVFQHATLMQ